MNRLLACAALILLIGCSSEARSATPRPTNERPRTVVLELFTSQGCSSCPPADRLLSKLRGEKFSGVVIPLAYHVDYWNHLGWSDPFSSPKWSERQREYAASIQGSQVYTPQLVINGTTQLVGSSERLIRTEIRRQFEGTDRGTVVINQLTRTGNALDLELQAKLDRGAAAGRVNVVVALFENGLSTAVTRGENASRNLTNDAIVRWQSRAFELAPDGTEVTAKVAIPLAKDWRSENLGVAVFLQDPQSRAILGSAAQRVAVK